MKITGFFKKKIEVYLDEMANELVKNEMMNNPNINQVSFNELNFDISDTVKKMINRKINHCKNKVTFDELDNFAKGKTIDNTKSKIAKFKDFVVNIVKLTINWLRDKIKSKLYKKMANQVAVFAMEDMLTLCNNQVSFAEFNNLAKDGYTHIITELDNNGKVQDIECIKDTSSQTDPDVKSFINKTGQGMVIVSS